MIIKPQLHINVAYKGLTCKIKCAGFFNQNALVDYEQ